MASKTYQTFTEETPIETYREDFLRRGAMCTAMVKRHPEMAPIGEQATGTVAQIDARRAALRAAEDDQIRARALEDVEKLDVLDVYTEMRRTMSAKSYDVLTLLPDSPSSLKRTGVATFTERMGQGIKNLQALPDGDAIKTAFLALLQKELAELGQADEAEDTTRAAVHAGGVALILYKAELSQAREAELGKIQGILGDREKTAMFTIPWRKPRRASGPEPEPEG